jgi:hypothetical protein
MVALSATAEIAPTTGLSAPRSKQKLKTAYAAGRRPLGCQTVGSPHRRRPRPALGEARATDGSRTLIAPSPAGRLAAADRALAFEAAANREGR